MRHAMMCMTIATMALGISAAAQTELPAAKPRPVVQMAILLDTSGSMSGLINQAKSTLWNVVNEFIAAKKDGMAPQLQVALYEYGNSRLDSKTGWIRQVLPLTDDLDKVSEQLFALTTNGGEEYCGQVIKEAVEKLEWGADKDTLRTIFIAGNEPFTQGQVDYRESCKAAATKGIIVNTIHCGDNAAGVQGQWPQGAALSDGRYMCIDQNRAVAHIAAPQDAQIARLNADLNGTYVPYGVNGKAGLTNQVAQDTNAANLSGSVAAQRSLSKSSGLYYNGKWDLVDATKNGDVKLQEITDKDLPENMQKMSAEERQAYVETQAKARAQLQEEIAKLGRERAVFVADEETKQAAATGQKTLDQALIEAVRAQATARNYQMGDMPR